MTYRSRCRLLPYNLFIPMGEPNEAGSEQQRKRGAAEGKRRRGSEKWTKGRGRSEGGRKERLIREIVDGNWKRFAELSS